MPTRKQLADALRVLALDAIDRANSGHPGAPLGMADMAEALWRHGYKHCPEHPTWFDRDRFVLSNGHASMLLYGLLHLTGYEVSLQDLKDFRRLGSITPGHPEYGLTPGVDITTGPLGQGVASAVGFALAERLLASSFNCDDLEIVNHYTYCFCGDGCLMEGVSAEACSLAGTWRLGKLIMWYDDNGISIDGEVKAWFSEDVAARFRAYGWQVLGPIDGHNFAELDAALTEAKAEKVKPTLIICKTHIGLGSPEEDSAKCHGAPLPKPSLAQTKAAYGWTYPPFEIPKEIYESWDARDKGRKDYERWQEAYAQYKQRYPEKALELERRLAKKWPKDLATLWEDLKASFKKDKAPLATRKASKKCLDALTGLLPELIGGSADLSGSVGTFTKNSKEFDPLKGEGNYLYYGVREFAMACIVNGLALHGGFIPYAGTFLAFSDQAKNALRLGALMQAKAIWVFTHDSIGVGEDGPTHQPIEQVPALRLIPGLEVWRPGDSLETLVAWKEALNADKPQALILSRQSLPFIEHQEEHFPLMAKGGYILEDSVGELDLILLATGSELALALKAREVLVQEGLKVRLVSMPCVEKFVSQPKSYQEEVLPLKVRKRIALEAAAKDYWWKFVGLDGLVLGLESFGVSAKSADVFEHFGFKVEEVVRLAHELLKKD
ncbi:MAG: transketolase [Desulfovibrionaceae bacterium]|nr:transketolase [Desulfovibrionaceae bacterium]